MITIARRAAGLPGPVGSSGHRPSCGHRVIDLGTGDPAFPTPVDVAEAGIRSIRGGQTHYTNVRGTPELRAAAARKFLRDNDLRYDDDQIIVGCGSKQPLAQALLATTEPGDEVLLLAPYYPVYAQMVTLAGGVPVVVPCRREDGFRVRPETLREHISPRTNWLVLNNPVNPTGVVYGRDELEAVWEVLAEHPRVGVLTDEIYEHITYGTERPFSFAAISAEAFERTVTVNGVSKAYSMTGWRLGYAGGPRHVIAAMAKLQFALTSCASSVSQAAAVQALTGDQQELRRRRKELGELRDLVLERLDASPLLTCVAPAGGIYVLVDSTAVLGRRTRTGTPIADDAALVGYLYDHAAVTTIPGSAFGAPGFVRVTFAVPRDDLAEALARLTAAVRELR